MLRTTGQCIQMMRRKQSGVSSQQNEAIPLQMFGRSQTQQQNQSRQIPLF